MTIVRIDYLGPLRVSAGDRSVEIRGRRLVALLVRLAMAPGRPVPVDVLADAVWPDGAPADPANALQSLVSRLRRALADAAAVEQTPAGYRLVVAPEAVDAARFDALAAQGRRLLAGGDPAAAAATLREALALWRGDPLPDAGEGTDIEAERIALRERQLGVLVDRIGADLRAGPDAAAVAELGRELDELAAALPLREDVAVLRMRALLDGGRPAQALLAYEAAREALAEALGTDPSPALRALHLEALRHESVAPTPPTTLRRSVTSFVGRDDDLRALVHRLATDRLVTLTGAGGSGKTRLATEAAGAVLDGAPGAPPAPDGVWFVELAPVTDPADLASAVLDGLGVREVAGDRTGLDAEPRRAAGARERLIEWVRGRTCLVVLDNCEHLVAAAADLAAEILSRAPGVRLLATSREPLGVDGEVVHPLSPLAVPDEGADAETVLASPAVRLLLDRAAAAGAEVARSPDDVAPLAAIVRRLDGLPLALELAAARLRLLSPSEVAARLDDRFRLLTGGRRTAVPRHRTLRAVVEWSWELLTDVEREVADHFCVFPGGATAEAVAAVCPSWRDAPDAAGAEVTDVLQGLVDKSLLVVDHGPSGTRLRMLETLREYGAEQLAVQGLGQDAHDAAACYVVDLVTRTDALMRGPGQADALRVLDAERDNVAAALAHLVDRGDARAALQLTLHLGWYWMLREQAEDALRWTGAVLALPGVDREPAGRTVRALGVAVSAAVPRSESPGDGADGRVSGPEAFAAASDDLADADDSYPPARILRPLLLFFADRRDEALRLIEERVTSDPDPWVRTAARTARMAFAENEGDLDRMRADVEAGVREWTALQDTWGLAAVLSARGQLRTLDGDLEGAAADFEEAKRRLEVLGTASDDLMVHMRMADLRLRAGDPRGARVHLDAMRRSRSPGELAALRDVLVEAMEASVVLAEHEHEQDSDAIAATGGRLLAALQSTGEPTAFQAHGTAVGYGALAALDLVRGDRTAAALHVREGYRQAVRTNDLPILGVVGLAVAEVALDAGTPVLAAEVAGASARLRGADDPGSPFVRRVVEEGRRLLGDRSWDEAYGRGRALDRAAAIARLDPDGVLDAPPDGSLDEDHPAPRVGDGVGPVVGAVQARRR